MEEMKIHHRCDNCVNKNNCSQPDLRKKYKNIVMRINLGVGEYPVFLCKDYIFNEDENNYILMEKKEDDDYWIIKNT